MRETIVADAEFDVLMTGDEEYQIIGDPKYQPLIKCIMKEFKGLPLYAGCFEKAVITQRNLGGSVCCGAMRVISGDFSSAYGFNYNPPIEVHCWVELDDLTIDLALPGVIMRGLKLRDEVGPFLKGRVPSVLFSSLPRWLIYQTVTTY